jgi:amidohydrolase
MDDEKEKINAAVDACRNEILELSHRIHDAPELGFEEYKACAKLTDVLQKHGFEVTTGVGGLETAFTARQSGRGNGPHVAFLAEYDALKGLGHGCGHNIIASAAVGAGIALASILDRYDGMVSIIGTPGEETKGGKIVLLDAGIFDNVDFVLMVHPTQGPSMIRRNAPACMSVFVKFTGVSAHSSAPATGINALSAVISTFNNIDLIRPTFRHMDNVNGVVVNGGGASNVIPATASCEFCLRSKTLTGLKALADKVECCAKSAQQITGASLEFQRDIMFSERYPNVPMGEAFKKNLEQLGETVAYPDPDGSYGSSDVSNVSLYRPTIQEYISIAPQEVNMHSEGFSAAAVSPRGDIACILGAKALAMTGLDILSNAAFRKQVADAFEKDVPRVYRKG